MFSSLFFTCVSWDRFIADGLRIRGCIWGSRLEDHMLELSSMFWIVRETFEEIFETLLCDPLSDPQAMYKPRQKFNFWNRMEESVKNFAIRFSCFYLETFTEN